VFTIIFFDIEVFPKFWCLVAYNDQLHQTKVFTDVKELQDYYKQNRKQTWVAYNGRQYDAPMIRFIMLGLDPYEMSTGLIVHEKKWFEFGYDITKLYKKIPLRHFDPILLNKGLKKLEAFRGSSIIECSIDWNIDRELTDEEKDEVIEYCKHDVMELRKVFLDTKEEYDSHESLVSAFELDDEHFNKSKAQLAALILNAEKQPRFDEWEFEIADTVRIERYTNVLDWYKDKSNHDYSKSLKCEIAGVPHVFAWGGIHGARKKYSGEGYFINMDVASYYPAMMIEYGFLSRNVLDPEKYRQIRDQRLIFKKEKDPRQLPYKIVLNSTYGAMKDKFNNLYDPRQANSVCVTGQLLLLDLMERLEDHCEIIQSNTDGVLVKLHKKEDYDKIVGIGQDWSKRTRMELEYETVSKVFQKDVNNYLTVDENGKYKSKGAWVKKLSSVDYDLPIVNEALVNYFSKGIPVEETINNCNELIKFQKIIMVSSKYKCALHGRADIEYQMKTKVKMIESKDPKDFKGYRINEKILRIFASTNESDGGIFKFHATTKRVSKVGDTPRHAFIISENIEGVSPNNYPLDRSYYIQMAKDRIKEFISKN
jgi:hypothetical protein